MKSLLLALSVLISTPAFAYYDVLDTGETLSKGNYKLTGATQFLTDHGGVNVEGMFDMGIGDEFGVRGLFGFGQTDIFAGGMFKWVPIPDIEGQPAIGMNIGLLYMKDGPIRDLTFRLEPLVSKKITGPATVWTPYASLPVGLRARDHRDSSNRTDLTWQVVGGTQLQVEKWKKLQFMAEVGMDLDQAVSHFTIAALLYFDDYGIGIE